MRETRPDVWIRKAIKNVYWIKQYPMSELRSLEELKTERARERDETKWWKERETKEELWQ